MATYLITQATGQQSQSVISHLLAAGARVHAVVRNPHKIPPVLEKQGVTIFKGESTNFEEILQAAQGCKGAFLNTFPWPGLEVQQAKTIVKACEKAGVENIVGCTTFTVGNKAIWDDAATEEVGLRQYFLSKAEVEAVLRGGKFKTYTILRPSVLHTDFMLPGVLGNFPGLPRGELDHACNDGVRLPYTDTHDVGKYAAAALQDPAKFGGQEIDLPNEYLTMEEVRDILVKVSGRDVRVRQQTPAEVEKAKQTVQGMLFQIWANVKDFTAFVDTAKEAQTKFGIPFTSLEMALQRDKARLLDCLPA
ncbi:NmrA-like family protein [Colletotrichum tofieldiae]|uniref:NmrA-like family protein n=1 Tax=Colletotrichum tofieldiae TaxID=708197 RepID=A0A166NAJ4_9PEZI|nr:NmrA-like family protein [Colletotrichum tofieldiae]GKT55727.1 NmrA-like family protein [Colletotrichum tofieldiae]GKT79437.1 NmrA-like family protein [Colletotrichum tofieldiae]GKT82613.1 nmrA-like family protein [Colletotrichum tofieldiae]